MKSNIPPALLYRRPRRSHTLSAFLVALAVSATAVAIAGMRSHIETQNVGNSTESFELVGIDDSDPVEDTAPTSMDDLPPEIPPDTPEFIEERPPVPAKRVNAVRPISRTPIPHGTTAAFGKAMTVFAPRPEYPYEARRQKITGSGVALIAVESMTGMVVDVSMAQTTGSPVLDSAATAGLKRWKFKPGTAARIRCPITFTLTGATY